MAENEQNQKLIIWRHKQNEENLINWPNGEEGRLKLQNEKWKKR